MSYIKDPKSIEVRSFEIITEGLAGKADHFSEEEQLIVKRLIHTTGDFDYVNIVEFQNNPIESAKEALEAGNCRIYCDTNMIVNGLNKNGLKNLELRRIAWWRIQMWRKKRKKEGLHVQWLDWKEH